MYHQIESWIFYIVNGKEDFITITIPNDFNAKGIVGYLGDPNVTLEQLSDTYLSFSDDFFEIVWTLGISFLWDLTVTKVNRALINAFIFGIVCNISPESVQYIKLYVLPAEKEKIISRMKIIVDGGGHPTVVIYHDSISFQHSINNIEEIRENCKLHILLIVI